MFSVYTLWLLMFCGFVDCLVVGCNCWVWYWVWGVSVDFLLDAYLVLDFMWLVARLWWGLLVSY